MMLKLNWHEVALVGNPNTGKSTLFNHLSGAKQKVGNWPGVTVEREIGNFNGLRLVDLPGCYTLEDDSESSPDESISSNYVRGAHNTLFINVIDATHLKRDLYLSLQLREMGLPMLVALNCTDLAAKKGINIDADSLSRQLGCPVVPIVAKSGQNVDVISQYTHSSKLEKFTEDNIPLVRDPLTRRKLIQEIVNKVQTKNNFNQQITQKIDSVVLHKIAGPLIFAGIMYLMFSASISLGSMLQGILEKPLDWLFIMQPKNLLLSLGSPSWLINLLVYGVCKGISITLSFVPVLSIMFLCLGLLEASGYMMRASFIVDGLMRILGLPGQAFVPMIVGFGCNVPAVMSTRTLANKKDRILTIMMLPFMSCSARLAIYAIFASAFFAHNGSLVIFSLYIVGILVALFTGFALRNNTKNNQHVLNFSEMPDYKKPELILLLKQVWWKVRGFIINAGTLIVLSSLIINGIGDAWLVVLGKILTPIFSPMGVGPDNWPATLALLTGLIAKEAVIGTLGSAYSDIVSSFGGPVSAYAYLLFTLLYFPCVSVISVIARELNYKWAVFSVIWSTTIAYVIATMFYQAAIGNLLWAIALGFVLLSFYKLARFIINNQKNVTVAIPTPISLK